MDNIGTNQGLNPEKPVSAGFYAAMLIFFLIPVIGLIAGLIILVSNRENPSKRNMGLACTVLSIAGLLIMGAGVYFAYGQIKKYDGYLHEYLGDYGSTLELAKDISNEDVPAVLSKIDLDLLIRQLDLENTLKGVDIASYTDLSSMDFDKIDWDSFSDEQLQNLYRAMPLDRLGL